MDFDQSQQTALLLAGTVALPSPFPAVGRVSLVLVTENGSHETFVKIFQVVSDKRMITRFVRREDIRAIRAPSPDAPDCGPETWPITGINKLRVEIDDKQERLVDRASRSPAPTEIGWLDAAIVYVSESSPVMHRDEVGVTAAVSAEDVGFCSPISACCHRERPSCC